MREAARNESSRRQQIGRRAANYSILPKLTAFTGEYVDTFTAACKFRTRGATCFQERHRGSYVTNSHVSRNFRSTSEGRTVRRISCACKASQTYAGKNRGLR